MESTNVKKTVTVDKEALFKILKALNGPSYYIHELQATKNLARLTGEINPIDQLKEDYVASGEL